MRTRNLALVFCLTIIVVASFSFLAGQAFRIANASPDFLQVSISPQSVKLGVGQIQEFTATIANRDAHYLPYFYTWTDSSGTVLGHSQTLLFSFKEASNGTVLSVTVASARGNQGYASVWVADPYTSASVYIDALQTGWIIQADGLGWYAAFNNGKLMYSSTTLNTVVQNAWTAFSSAGGGTMILKGVLFDTTLIASIPTNVIVEQQYANRPSTSWTRYGPIRSISPSGHNAAWVGQGSNDLTLYISSVISTLVNNEIKYAIILVGYWNATTPTLPRINYHYNQTWLAQVCVAFKTSGIIPIAWIEGGVSFGESEGTPNITPTYYSVYNAKILEAVALGFDGYSDDIEVYTGTVSQYIAFQNQVYTLLHPMGLLTMPAIPANTGGASYNSLLHVDYILSMFYWAKSLFEDADSEIYWQENFGLGVYHGAFGRPASPIILGILTPTLANGSSINTHPLSWQLTQFNNFTDNYGGSANLFGVCLFAYDFMNGTDWDAWRIWNNNWGA